MTDQASWTYAPTQPAAPKRSRLRRMLVGGALSDLGRLPRYVAFALLGGTLIWAPITGYLKTAPERYKSVASLILPGSGASASLNLNGIGQASSYANSAFASNAVSPTETYKRLLGADRILAAAAASLEIPRSALGRPRVNLVDQTSLIHIEMVGNSPVDAQARADAILFAFYAELDALRTDEVDTREDSGLQAIADYRDSVAATRSEITALQAETGLLSMKQYEDLVDRHMTLEARLKDVMAVLSDKTAEVQQLQMQLNITAQRAAVTLKLFADGAYLTMLDTVAEFEADFAETSALYGSRHPKVQEARRTRDEALTAAQRLATGITGLSDEDIAALDLAPNGVRADLLSQLVEKDAERAGLAQELASLEGQFADAEDDIDRKRVAAATLQDLERDFAVAEAVFASAIARTQSSKSDFYASYPLVQMLENPSLPEKPSSPNKKLAIAAGGAATFMMLIGLLIGWTRQAIIGRLLSSKTSA
ncbi:GumC family protein [Ruegeria hyattellae]|uniref:GumC family protein n=1 Tax=Ruegeria hyattellae TaxID=3233337 RepID=UPI00355BA88F